MATLGPVSAWLILAALVPALLVARFAARYMPVPLVEGRNDSIDGLRGYLAFFVFLHHTAVWYFYLRTGTWDVPPSRLFAHLGQSSVALFFMITGFLFWSKLLDGRSRGIDWVRLYVSRVLRLTPLYLFAMLVLLSIVAILSGFRLMEPLPRLLLHTMEWLTFTAIGKPDINTVPETFTIIAGVTWSLRYEWLFYLSLPALALLLRMAPTWPWLLMSMLTIAGAAVIAPEPIHFVAFGGGMIAAVLVRYKSLRQTFAKPAATFVALAACAATIALPPHSYSIIAMALLTAAFTIIACGNTLFGLLIKPVSRVLGEVAYSIYLLHGIVLFIVFRFVIGLEAARSLSVAQHYVVVLVCAPVLVALSCVTFRLIEQPAMRLVPAVTDWLKRRGATRQPECVDSSRRTTSIRSSGNSRIDS